MSDDQLKQCDSPEKTSVQTPTADGRPPPRKRPAKAAQADEARATEPSKRGDALARRRGRREVQALDIAQGPPTIEELGYLAAEFVMCTLPHSDPGDVPVWTRRDGCFTLSIQAGYDKDGRGYGLPYGPIPRLALVWLVGEALRVGPRIDAGNSLSEFLRKLGYSADTGRGERGDATRVLNQISRLFYCLITFEYWSPLTKNTVSLRMLPVERSEFHFDGKTPVTIELSKRFYEAVTARPVPLDLRILNHFRHSPLALDFYAFAVRESGRAQQQGKDRFVAWEWLDKQLGANYAEVRNFRDKMLPFVEELVRLCPRLLVSVQRGGRGQKAGLVFSRFSEPVPRKEPFLLTLD
jgi:hypothetical protein